MAHPLANDPTVPAVLRAAFARVTCQIVRIYDNGSEGVINMTDRAKAESELVEHAKRIGNSYDTPDSATGRMTLVAVEIRAVA